MRRTGRPHDGGVRAELDGGLVATIGGVVGVEVVGVAVRDLTVVRGLGVVSGLGVVEVREVLGTVGALGVRGVCCVFGGLFVVRVRRLRVSLGGARLGLGDVLERELRGVLGLRGVLVGDDRLGLGGRLVPRGRVVGAGVGREDGGCPLAGGVVGLVAVRALGGVGAGVGVLVLTGVLGVGPGGGVPLAGGVVRGPGVVRGVVSYGPVVVP